MGTNKRATILAVDDERGVRQSFKMVLKDEYDVLLAGTGEQAIDTLSRTPVDVVLLDIRLPDIDGLDLLQELKETEPDTEVIAVTAVKDIETAVRAIKLGAYDYIQKPFGVDNVINIINRALEKHSLVKEATYLKKELERYHPFEKIIGKNEKMGKVFSLISIISGTDGAVLIQGESGTGKELVAREIHNLSPRRNQPFIIINSAAIPPTLMESELFGHNRGAFTGATRTELGKLEIADKGTVFLDDVDTLNIGMQAKLLRAIQEKEFERLGSTRVIKVDVRYLASSNRDLLELVSQGKFREDLFYRLNVFPLNLPPLRERRDDIPLLLDHFLDLHAKRMGKFPKRFSKRAVKTLMEHPWPGNVRELQNLVERLSTITMEPIIHFKDISMFNVAIKQTEGWGLRKAVTGFERRHISRVLEIVDGNRKKAAKMLEIHRNTLLAKINQLGLKT